MDTHFADDDTIKHIAKLEAENEALRHELQEANGYANRMADEKHIALSECEALRRDAEQVKSKRTPGEWGKSEDYYGFIDRKDGRYFCALHNALPEILNVMEQMAKTLDRIYEADATDNNGAVMGEAHLCRYFSNRAKESLAAYAKLKGE